MNALESIASGWLFGLKEEVSSRNLAWLGKIEGSVALLSSVQVAEDLYEFLILEFLLAEQFLFSSEAVDSAINYEFKTSSEWAFRV
jgi:hypothetical protein